MLVLSAGAVLVLGILVAPVIFGSEKYFLEEILVRSQEGILMGTIFLNFSKWLAILTIIISVFEIYELRVHRDYFALITAVVAVVTALLFYGYYAPTIMQMLHDSNTLNSAFDSLHKGSEMNAKIMTFAFLILAWRRALSLRIS